MYTGSPVSEKTSTRQLGAFGSYKAPPQSHTPIGPGECSRSIVVSPVCLYTGLIEVGERGGTPWPLGPAARAEALHGVHQLVSSADWLIAHEPITTL
jgi:hypothetical protein